MKPSTDRARDASAPSPCLDDSAIAELIEGQMAPEARVRAEAHLDGCADCRQIVAELARGKSAPLDARDSERPSNVALGLDSTTEVDTERLPRSLGPPGVKAGDVLASKYRVEELLGTGGMGVVVAATHLQLGRRVALKFMRAEATGSFETVARFLREARAAAQIESEHVAHVLDFGTLQGGEPFMVMELLRGKDLAALLEDDGPTSLPDAIDYVLQACEALAEAHKLGIIHRDLKPANLFLASRADGSPIVKVLDFGISKLSDQAASTGESSLTGSRAAVGSPRYMSPEQLQSPKSVGPRVDLWALGCVLYELLTARAAFDAETVHGVAVAIATASAPKVRDVRPELPARMEDVILACLEKDPSRRVASIHELARLLAPLAPPRSQPSLERIYRLGGASLVPEASPIAGEAHAWASRSSPSVGIRRWAPVAIASFVVAAGLAGFRVNHAGDAAATARPPASSPVIAAQPLPSPSPPAAMSTPPSMTAAVAPSLTPPAVSAHEQPPLAHPRPHGKPKTPPSTTSPERDLIE